MLGILDSNFKYIHLDCHARQGTALEATLDLAIADDRSLATLLEELCKNVEFIVDHIKYSFSVELFTAQVPQTQPDQPIPIECLRFKFAAAFCNKILPFLDAQLYKLGYGFDLHEIYAIRSAIFISDEKFYLQRAQKILAVLCTKVDDPISIEHNQLIRLSYEIPAHARYSFIYKVANILRFNGFNRCALAMISIYSENPGCKNFIAASIPPTELELDEIVNSDKFIFSKNDYRMDLNNTEGIVNLRLILPEGDFKTSLYENLRQNNKIILQHDTYAFNVELSLTTSGVVEPCIRIYFDYVDLHHAFNFTFQQLEKFGFLLDIKNKYTLRKHSGGYKVNGYLQYAEDHLNNLLAKGDDLCAYEHNMLVELSYELPTKLRADFICQIINILKDQGFYNCALAHAALYRADETHPAIASAVASIEYVLSVRPIMQMLDNVPGNETDEQKQQRLKDTISKICTLGKYQELKELADKLLFELAGVPPMDATQEQQAEVMQLVNIEDLVLMFNSIKEYRTRREASADVLLPTRQALTTVFDTTIHGARKVEPHKPRFCPCACVIS